MTNLRQNSVVLIAGPTASGKSASALAIAERIGGIIVNADAMQVYADLSIISARPSAPEQARVPHHLFGHVDAQERYSVGAWLTDVETVLNDASARDQPVVCVGGTGLYYKALLEGLSSIPEIPSRITGRWQHAMKDDGPWALHAVLTAQDPETADMLEPGDSQRIVRALAVKEATGKSIHQFGNSAPLVGENDIVLCAALVPDRQLLYERIDERFDQMIAAGALKEVTALIARDLDADLPAMRAIGVPELATHLAGEATFDEAVNKAKTNSRRYAKRQMTWIRGQMDGWTQFDDPATLVSQCLDLCLDRA